MTYEIQYDGDLFIVRLNGRITGANLLAATRALVAHPEFQKNHPRIWDARGVTELLLDIENVHDVRAASIEQVQALGTTTRAAVVAVREIDRAAAQLFRAYLKGRPIEVFDTMATARAWVLES